MAIDSYGRRLSCWRFTAVVGISGAWSRCLVTLFPTKHRLGEGLGREGRCKEGRNRGGKKQSREETEEGRNVEGKSRKGRKGREETGREEAEREEAGREEAGREETEEGRSRAEAGRFPLLPRRTAVDNLFLFHNLCN